MHYAELQVRTIYDEAWSAWKATKADISFFTDTVDRLRKAQGELETFIGQLTEGDEAVK